ncbi:hypothetical protein D3C85_1670260 [compost metagenome]
MPTAAGSAVSCTITRTILVEFVLICGEIIAGADNEAVIPDSCTGALVSEEEAAKA